MSHDHEATEPVSPDPADPHAPHDPQSPHDASAPLDASDQEERAEFTAAFEADSSDGSEPRDLAPELLDRTSEPYLGQWNRLISSTNWEKGRIISEWRAALIESGAAASEYSDDAWARRAGGVTAPHVGRLRRVHDHFGNDHENYAGLYWSHFLAALDWDDAPLWLEGAMQSGWSVSQMREQRWQAQGGKPTEKPADGDLAVVDMDEDIIEPAQGGGGGKYREEEPDGVSAGPDYEAPDFGEDPSRDALDGAAMGEPESNDAPAAPGTLIQPFRDLPELPPDLSEAVEMFKLAILRHKAENWGAVEATDVVRYLVGLRMLVEARDA